MFKPLFRVLLQHAFFFCYVSPSTYLILGLSTISPNFVPFTHIKTSRTFFSR